MSSLLIRLLVLIFILWLIRRFIAGLMGHARRPGARSANSGSQSANHTVKDPVCGMYLDPRLAVHYDQGKESQYFCSEECKQKFVAGLS
jgi:Cu+-exporting ATPase